MEKIWLWESYEPDPLKEIKEDFSNLKKLILENQDPKNNIEQYIPRMSYVPKTMEEYDRLMLWYNEAILVREKIIDIIDRSVIIIDIFERSRSWIDNQDVHSLMQLLNLNLLDLKHFMEIPDVRFKAAKKYLYTPEIYVHSIESDWTIFINLLNQNNEYAYYSETSGRWEFECKQVAIRMRVEYFLFTRESGFTFAVPEIPFLPPMPRKPEIVDVKQVKDIELVHKPSTKKTMIKENLKELSEEEKKQIISKRMDGIVSTYTNGKYTSSVDENWISLSDEVYHKLRERVLEDLASTKDRRWFVANKCDIVDNKHILRQ